MPRQAHRQDDTQTNDYSYNADDLTDHAHWDQVTLHQNGTLGWGTPP